MEQSSGTILSDFSHPNQAIHVVRPAEKSKARTYPAIKKNYKRKSLNRSA